MHLSFTASTLPLLALAAYLWYRAKGQLLPVVMFLSIFQAASVLNLGIGGFEIGIAPAHFVLILALVKRLSVRTPLQSGAEKPSYAAMLLLTLFVGYAAVSVFTNPFLFRGVPVTNPRAGWDVPLQWAPGYLTQLCYLLLSFALYLAATYRTSRDELGRSLNWFIAGIVCASLIAFYQVAALKTGIYFPGSLFYTNPTHVIYNAYEISGLPRANSTFTEASMAAFAMSVGLALVVWRFASGAAAPRSALFAALISGALILTASSTGYLCLAYVLVVGAWLYMFRWNSHRDTGKLKIVMGIPVLVLLAALLAVPAVRQGLMGAVHTVVLDKTESFSYRQRSLMDGRALDTAAATYWLGAGWGVCRASSFLPTLLGNVGVPGLLLFSGFCICVFLPALRPRRVLPAVHGAVLFALSTALLALFLALPDAVDPMLWLLFALAAKFAGPRRLAKITKMRATGSATAKERDSDPVLTNCYDPQTEIRG
jgi:hypothetical protein